MGKLGHIKKMHRKPFTMASADPLYVPGHESKIMVTGSVTINTIPAHAADQGRRLMFIGGASAAAVFANNNSPTTAGQMDLGGSNITLGEDDVLELELKVSDTNVPTWRRIAGEVNN